jgi:alpha-tubulin suppressor-like RCC1 family protein
MSSEFIVPVSNPEHAMWPARPPCHPGAPFARRSRGTARFRAFPPLKVLPVLVLTALGCGQERQSPTEPETTPALAAAAAAPLGFRQISAGWFHTCGVASDNRAYCWGQNVVGQLGDGTTTQRARPTLVATSLRFVMVSAGSAHTCGITTDNRAFCWGDNQWGQLGDGTITRRLTPMAVAGGRHFSQVHSGSVHTCAVNLVDAAFCWGLNTSGWLGNNTTTASRIPVNVRAGGVTFRNVFATGVHTCGAATNFVGYCWGRNEDGQLGDGTTIRKLKPTQVLGGHSFRQVTAGAVHGGSWNSVSCGLTTDDRAYCWGDNRFGALGDGTTDHRSQPVAVSGGFLFEAISIGGVHTCGVTPGHAIYCWGSNGNWQLGNGTNTDQHTPNHIASQLPFRAVTTGAFHTCGITTTNRAYCWGINFDGQLGIGTVDSGAGFHPHSTPEPVVGPL